MVESLLGGMASVCFHRGFCVRGISVSGTARENDSPQNGVSSFELLGEDAVLEWGSSAIHPGTRGFALVLRGRI